MSLLSGMPKSNEHVKNVCLDFDVQLHDFFSVKFRS